MNEIKFYHNAPDRIAAACSITGKAVARGHKVVVYAPDEALARRFDNQLWTLQALSFVPHVGQDSPLASRTPVVIGRTLANMPHHDVLINLGHDLPAGFERFDMLVEVVSRDGEDVPAARRRWQGYKQQGLAVTAHDLAQLA